MNKYTQKDIYYDLRAQQLLNTKTKQFFFFEICFWPFHKKYQNSYHKKLNYQTYINVNKSDTDEKSEEEAEDR